MAATAWLYFNSIRAGVITEGMQNADAAFKRKDIPQAKKLLDGEIAQHPEDVSTYVGVGDVCMANREWDLAVAYATLGTRNCGYAQPTDRSQLYVVLASAESHIRTPAAQSDAIDHATRAQELNPEDPDVLNALGYILADKNTKLDQAQDMITRALRTLAKSPDTPPSKLGAVEDSYGWVLCRRGQYDAAIDALNQAIEDMQTDSQPSEGLSDAYYHLGVACRNAARIEWARSALQKALFYDPGCELAKTELAKLPPEPPAAAQDAGSPAAVSPSPAAPAPAPPAPPAPPANTLPAPIRSEHLPPLRAASPHERAHARPPYQQPAHTQSPPASPSSLQVPDAGASAPPRSARR